MRALGSAISIWITAILLTALPVFAEDKERLEAFLEVTGFDVALESIRLSASSAPDMLGLQAEDFGSEWVRLTRSIFDTEKMHDMAIDILGQTLDDEMLVHASDFYVSDFGQRLVVAENASHMFEDDDFKRESGEAIVAGLEQLGSQRLEYLQRMNAATDSAGTGVRAIQEVQVRFLMAAAAAGVIELQMDEPDLRELLRSDEEALKADLEQGALVNSAYTYQSFSDDEILAYAEALEHPKMRVVYDLMNAVQFEIMANRYEALAIAMQDLQPSQDI